MTGAVAVPEHIDWPAEPEIFGTGLTGTLYVAGREVHPAAEAVIEKATVSWMLPLFEKVRSTGLSV